LIDCQVHNALHFDRFGGKKAIIFDRRECSLLFKLGHLFAAKGPLSMFSNGQGHMAELLQCFMRAISAAQKI
jgi:hypothetical protein